jgi:two-component system, sensor histidine kinase and response regulator
MGRLAARGRSIGAGALLALCLASQGPAQTGRDAEARITVAGPAEFPPFFIRDTNGNLTGSRVETWRAWQEATGIEVEFLLRDWPEALAAFEAGEADVMDSIVETPERLERMRFSEPFITINASLFYSTELLGISDAASVRPYVVGVLDRDACEEFLRAAGHDALRRYPNPAALIAGSLTDEVQVFCMLEQQGRYLLAEQDASDLFRVSPPLYEAPGRWAVLRGEGALFRRVVAGFDDIPAARLQDIEDRWYGRSLTGDDGVLDSLRRLPLLEIMIGIAVVLGGGIVWIVTLRHQVRVETRERRASEDALIERVKELNTILRTNDLMQKFGGDLSRLVHDLASDLPRGFWQPAHCHARVRIETDVCDLIGSRRIVAQRSWPILRDGEPVGEITIAYDRLSPEQEAQGAFLSEEFAMMHMLVDKIGSRLSRWKVADDLARSEDRFRRLFFNTGQPIATIEGGLFSSVNAAALALLGHDRRDAIEGKTPLDISPETQPCGTPSAVLAEQYLAEAREKGSVGFDWEHLHANGGTRLIKVLLTSIERTEPTIYQVIWTDITAQREAEEVLARYRQRLEQEVAERTRDLNTTNNELMAILSAASSGIVLIREGRIAAVNPAAEEMFGTTHDGLISRSPAEFWAEHGSYRDFIDAALAELLEGKPVKREVLLRKQSGAVFWARLGASIVDPDDVEAGSVWIVTDVTEEHDAREALQEARRLAEEAARMKSDFLSNMSHELRTPLNAIMGFAQILLKSDMTPNQHRQVEKINTAGGNLLMIINDILDLAKAEAGRVQLEVIDFDLNQVVRNAVAMITDKAAEKRIEIITRIDPGLHRTLSGDPTRLGQVLVNLLSNAVKFTEIGEIVLDVTRRQDAEGAFWLDVRVSDTGIGMSGESLKKLFNSFTQIDSSTTRRYGGTGLGLAICKQLIELMGGNVGVESDLGAGSKFWFSLPYRPSGTLLQQDLGPDVFRRDARVLVLDPNTTARQAICDVVTALGLRPVAVADAEAAISELGKAIAAGNGHDVALVDDDLSPEGRLEIVERLQDDLGDSCPPIIALVHSSAAETHRLAGHVRDVQTVQKPLDISMLHDALVEIWGRARAERPASARRTSHRRVLRGAKSLKGRRVLVCDDNPINLEIASLYLAELGIQVQTVASGPEALEALTRASFDLVLMDRRMTGMDGLEAARRIRQLPAPAGHVPIIALTASASPESRAEVLAAGMLDLVPKPIDFDVLETALTRVLCGDAQPAPDATPRGVTASAPKPPSSDGTAQGLVARLRGIASLDPEKGLRLARGKIGTYTTLLGHFCRNAPLAAAGLRDAVGQADRTRVVEMAHKLRGSAGQIGATAIAETAAGIEEAHLDPEAAVDGDRILGLATSVEALVAALAPHLAPDPAAASGPAPSATDPGKDAAVLREIVEAARRQDFRMLRLIVEHDDTLLRLLTDDSYVALCVATEKFDFGTIQQLVESALSPAEPT